MGCACQKSTIIRSNSERSISSDQCQRQCIQSSGELTIFPPIYKIERMERVSEGRKKSLNRQINQADRKMGLEDFRSGSSPNVLTFIDTKHPLLNLDLIEPNQYITPTIYFRSTRKNKKNPSILTNDKQQKSHSHGKQNLLNSESSSSFHQSHISRLSDQKRPLKPSIKSLSNYSRMNSPNPSQKSVRWDLGSDLNTFLNLKNQTNNQFATLS